MQFSRKFQILFFLTLLIAIAPVLFPSGYYFRVGSTVFVNSIAVTGMVILTGYAGQISLGHAGFAGIGGYACALAPKYLGFPSWSAVLLGAAVSAAIAWLIGRPILRLKGYYLGVATLGFGILVAMILSNERHLTKGPDGIAVQDLGLRSWLKESGINVTNGELWYFLTALALLIGVWVALNLYNSPTGRALRALHGSQIAAGTVGIDVATAKLQAFVISAVYASVAGSLLALQNRFVTPDIAGFMHSIEMVTMAVLGGVTSITGAIFGAAVLTLLPQVLTVFAEYEQLILGLVMMVVMIFLPAGVVPSIQQAFKGRAK